MPTILQTTNAVRTQVLRSKFMEQLHRERFKQLHEVEENEPTRVPMKTSMHRSGRS